MNKINFIDLDLPSGTLWAEFNLGTNTDDLNYAKNWYGNLYRYKDAEKIGNCSTSDDWAELLKNTKSEWITSYKNITGLNGLLIHSLKNPNKTLFFPAAGWKIGSILGDQETDLNYWVIPGLRGLCYPGGYYYVSEKDGKCERPIISINSEFHKRGMDNNFQFNSFNVYGYLSIRQIKHKSTFKNYLLNIISDRYKIEMNRYNKYDKPFGRTGIIKKFKETFNNNKKYIESITEKFNFNETQFNFNSVKENLTLNEQYAYLNEERVLSKKFFDENFKIKTRPGFHYKEYVDKTTGAYVTSVPSDDKPTGTMKFFAKHGISKVYGGSIGFSEKEQKWYGWSHRAIYGFGIGSKIKKGDCGYKGKAWTAKTLDDAKQMAKDFADAVS